MLVLQCVVLCWDIVELLEYEAYLEEAHCLVYIFDNCLPSLSLILSCYSRPFDKAAQKSNTEPALSRTAHYMTMKFILFLVSFPTPLTVLSRITFQIRFLYSNPVSRSDPTKT